MYWRYRRNADQSLRELEREYAASGDLDTLQKLNLKLEREYAISGDLGMLQRLNLNRTRNGMCPLRGDLDRNIFYEYFSNYINPDLYMMSLDPQHTQFPAYQIKTSTGDDMRLPILVDRSAFEDTLFLMRRAAQESICSNFFGIIDYRHDFRPDRQCPECRRSPVTLVDTQEDNWGDIVETLECPDCADPYEQPLPTPNYYPYLYLLTREIMHSSGDPLLENYRFPGGSQLVADAWMKDEDPLTLTDPSRRRGSYPTKIVLGQKKGMGYVEGRLAEGVDLHSTWQAYYSYDADQGMSPISLGQGDYDLHPVEDAYANYARRLLRIDRRNNVELII